MRSYNVTLSGPSTSDILPTPRMRERIKSRSSCNVGPTKVSDRTVILLIVTAATTFGRNANGTTCSGSSRLIGMLIVGLYCETILL